MTTQAVKAQGDELVLTPMVRGDLRDVLGIERQSPTSAWTKSMFVQELRANKRHYVCAHLGEGVVGFGGIIAIAGEGHIANLGVHENFRRLGIATHLLLDLVAGAEEMDCRALTLEVAVSNHAAQALYSRFGFVPAGVRRNYYSATNEDALIMWAHDIDLDQFGERMLAIQANLKSVEAEKR